MSKRARQRHRPHGPASPRPALGQGPATAEPERLLLDQIADGGSIPTCRRWPRRSARLHLLHTVRSVSALAMLNVGDRVRINHRARPRYLHGVQGTILELDERSATIGTHRPVGRFTSGEIRCPPLALDRVNADTEPHPRRPARS